MQPSDLSATALSSTEIRVSWSDDNNNQSRVSSYEIRYFPLDHPQAIDMVTTSPNKSVELSGLGKYMRYSIRVRVVGVGMAEMSDYSELQARTDEDGELVRESL